MLSGSCFEYFSSYVIKLDEVSTKLSAADFSAFIWTWKSIFTGGKLDALWDFDSLEVLRIVWLAFWQMSHSRFLLLFSLDSLVCRHKKHSKKAFMTFNRQQQLINSLHNRHAMHLNRLRTFIFVWLCNKSDKKSSIRCGYNRERNTRNFAEFIDNPSTSFISQEHFLRRWNLDAEKVNNDAWALENDASEAKTPLTKLPRTNPLSLSKKLNESRAKNLEVPWTQSQQWIVKFVLEIYHIFVFG